MGDGAGTTESGARHNRHSKGADGKRTPALGYHCVEVKLKTQADRRHVYYKTIASSTSPFKQNKKATNI